MSIKTDEINKIKDEYDLIIVAYENEKNETLKNVLIELKEKKRTTKIGVLIGPEGGISEREISMLNAPNIKKVTIGKRILRTETASLAISSMIMYEFEL